MVSVQTDGIAAGLLGCCGEMSWPVPLKSAYYYCWQLHNPLPQTLVEAGVLFWPAAEPIAWSVKKAKKRVITIEAMLIYFLSCSKCKVNPRSNVKGTYSRVSLWSCKNRQDGKFTCVAQCWAQRHSAEHWLTNCWRINYWPLLGCIRKLLQQR